MSTLANWLPNSGSAFSESAARGIERARARDPDGANLIAGAACDFASVGNGISVWQIAGVSTVINTGARYNLAFLGVD